MATKSERTSRIPGNHCCEKTISLLFAHPLKLLLLSHAFPPFALVAISETALVHFHEVAKPTEKLSMPAWTAIKILKRVFNVTQIHFYY